VTSKALVWLVLRSWRWRLHVPPKRQLTFTGLHGFIPQKTESFITTAVILNYFRLICIHQIGPVLLPEQTLVNVSCLYNPHRLISIPVSCSAGPVFTSRSLDWHPGWDFSWFSSFPPGIFQNSALNWSMTASFLIISNSLFINYPNIYT
jgi:hypothetical protein